MSSYHLTAYLIASNYSTFMAEKTHKQVTEELTHSQLQTIQCCSWNLSFIFICYKTIRGETKKYVISKNWYLKRLKRTSTNDLFTVWFPYRKFCLPVQGRPPYYIHTYIQCDSDKARVFHWRININRQRLCWPLFSYVPSVIFKWFVWKPDGSAVTIFGTFYLRRRPNTTKQKKARGQLRFNAPTWTLISFGKHGTKKESSSVRAET